MARRPSGGIFGDAWVFPGGIAEEVDGHNLDQALPTAAARELFEEVGVEVQVSELVFLSRWITPIEMPKRYDTWFFVTSLTEIPRLAISSAEVAEAQFVSPSVALAAHQAQQWRILLPTLAHLRWLARHPSPEATIASARAHAAREPISPRLQPDGSILGADLPW